VRRKKSQRNKVYEMTKIIETKTNKIKELEYQNYMLSKEAKELKEKITKMEQELEKSKSDVGRLMDVLYGVDKAKEYAKLDAESLRTKQIQGYHVGPPVHVVRRMYNGIRVRLFNRGVV
jgi:septal ring factor EnvC (AmiA/AmiB activator)